jgi:hypothetical protein
MIIYDMSEKFSRVPKKNQGDILELILWKKKRNPNTKELNKWIFKKSSFEP